MCNRSFVVAVLAVTVMGGCRLFGADATSCTPNDATTCPTGFVCNQAGTCVGGAVEGEGEAPLGEGEGEEGEGEVGEGEGEGVVETVVPATNQAVLIAVQGTTLFWAERAVGGALVRQATTDGVPEIMFQQAGTRVSSLVVGVEDVYFAVERSGADLDDVLSLPRGATAEDAPDVLTEAPVNLGTLAGRGPNALVVTEQVAAGEVSAASLAWIRPDDGPISTEIPLLDRLELPGGERTVVSSNGASSPRFAPGALAKLDNYNVVFESVNNQTFCLYNYTTTAVADIFDCILDESLTATPPGMPWSSERVGNAIFVSVKRSDGSGSIYRAVEFGDGDLFSRDIQLQSFLNVVDDNNALTYAADFATDGLNLYYTTAGTQGPFSLMRANTETLVVDRLVELEAEGAGVAVDSDYIYYAIPQLNRIDRIAR